MSLRHFCLALQQCYKGQKKWEYLAHEHHCLLVLPYSNTTKGRRSGSTWLKSITDCLSCLTAIPQKTEEGRVPSSSASLTVCFALQQYYKGQKKWEYLPVVGFAKAFDQTEMAKRTRGALAQPFEAPNPKCEEALIKYKYALNGERLLPWIALHPSLKICSGGTASLCCKDCFYILKVRLHPESAWSLCLHNNSFALST